MYRIRGENALLLYIGISENPWRRWTEHSREKSWWTEMRSLSIDSWFDDRAEAERAEKDAIKVELPKYNNKHAAPSMRQRPQMAISGTLGIPYPASGNDPRERSWVPGWALFPEAHILVAEGLLRGTPSRTPRTASPT